MIVVAYLITADFAEVINGKAYIQGAGWDRLTVTSGFPHQRHVAIALGLDIPWDSTNEQHDFKLALLAEDQQAKQLVAAEGVLEQGRPPGLAPGQTQLIQFAMSGIAVFERPGQYVVVVEIGGEEVGRRAFSVVDGSPQPPKTRAERGPRS